MRMLLGQIYWEVRKLFGRKRTFLGFAAFLAAELLILGILQLPRPQQSFARLLADNGYLFAEYFSGLTLAYLMMANTAFLLGSLFLALVSGDVVAKEVEDGTMRMLLSQPVSRLRILLLKYTACAIYTAALVCFITASSLLAGILFKGVGKLFVYSPVESVFALFETAEGLVRFGLAAGVLSLTFLTISSLGFMFSCFNLKPATATIITLTVFFIDMVLRLIPYFESIKRWLLTRNMASWMDVFQPYVPWNNIAENLLYLGAWSATFAAIGVVTFQMRDLKR